MTDEEKKKLEAKAKQNGFNSLSTYLKYVGLNAKVVTTVPKVGSKKD